MISERKITIELHCHHLPGTHFAGRTAVRLGIQQGQTVIDDVAGDASGVTFAIPLRVVKNAKDGTPNFLGPFAHGTPDQRFLYLSWGERNGEQWEMFRRAKIHLNHLGWPTLENAAKTGQPIQVFVDMTDAKGGPLCASVRAENIEWRI